MAVDLFKHDHARELLTGDQLQALGIISVECSAIEEYVNQLLPVAAGTSSESAMVLLGAGTSLGRKLDMLHELATLNFSGAQQQQFISALSLAKKAIGDRSILLHGVWQYSGNMLKVLLTGVPRKPGEAEVVNRRKAKQKPVKAAQILQIASDVSRAHRAIYNLWVEHFVRPGLVDGMKMTNDARQLIQELSAPKVKKL